VPVLSTVHPAVPSFAGFVHTLTSLTAMVWKQCPPGYSKPKLSATLPNMLYSAPTPAYLCTNMSVAVLVKSKYTSVPCYFLQLHLRQQTPDVHAYLRVHAGLHVSFTRTAFRPPSYRHGMKSFTVLCVCCCALCIYPACLCLQVAASSWQTATTAVQCSPHSTALSSWQPDSASQHTRQPSCSYTAGLLRLFWDVCKVSLLLSLSMTVGCVVVSFDCRCVVCDPVIRCPARQRHTHCWDSTAACTCANIRGHCSG
jgi:hypothetical protein